MYDELTNATLRTGEVVTAAVIRAPDVAWAERVEHMLQHKGDPWNWQNSELLRREPGLEASFFILHRAGVPLANIMLAETAGVGLLGHVWTEPADRRTGASSILMELLLDDFRARRGRAIFLGTDYDTPPWHYYRRRGFESVEPASGYMECYMQPRDEFEQAWFGATATVLEPLDWPHWAASAPLFLGAFEGSVRIAATQLVGRISSEGPLLPLIREERRRRAAGEPGCARVLRDASSSAVLGFACRQPHPLWPKMDLVDVYCHPRWWHRAADLVHALPAPSTARAVAYADAGHAAKQAVLEQAGFIESARLPRRVAAAPGGPFLDVTAFCQG